MALSAMGTHAHDGTKWRLVLFGRARTTTAPFLGTRSSPISLALFFLTFSPFSMTALLSCAAKDT